jgi:hypothetical protein
MATDQLIFRSTHKKNYTVFSNDLIAEPTLSWKAKGILMYLLSKPPGWKTRLEDIVKHAKDGRDAVLSGIKELRDAGYIKKICIRDPKTQRIIRWETQVFETPLDPDSDFPDLDNPDSGKPESGNPNPIKYLGVSNDEINTEKKKIIKNNIDSYGVAVCVGGENFSNNGLAKENNSIGGLVGPNNQERVEVPPSIASSPSNDKVEKPKQKWSIGDPILVDHDGWINFTLTKPTSRWAEIYYEAVSKSIRDTQWWIIENHVDPGEIYYDEDDELVYIKGDGYEVEEAFGQGGKLPLRKLRNIAADEAHGSLYQDDFNEYMLNRFNYWVNYQNDGLPF